MVIVWLLSPNPSIPEPDLTEGIEGVTLKLLLRRPSVLPTFEGLCEAGALTRIQEVEYYGEYEDEDYERCEDRLQRM